MKYFIKKFSYLNNFDNYPDGVIVLDSLNNIVYWNKKADDIFGFNSKEMIGRNIAMVFDNETEKIYQSIDDNKSFVLSANNAENKELFIEISCNELSKQEQVIITIREVTSNQKILEKLLVEYEKAAKICQKKSSFISGLSNDLKTPIHSIIGFSQGILDGICGELNEKQEKYITIINKNAAQLLEYINTIMDLSFIEVGKINTDFKVFDIKELIKTSSAKIKFDAESKNLSFETDLNDVIRKNIYTDEALLKTVIDNLLQNAVKFTETGSIKFKVCHPDLESAKKIGLEVPEDFTEKSFLHFIISDTGIGIANEEIPTIFDEYLQTDRAIAKKHGGTGLKLALTKKIVSLLKGAIWAESDLSQGSTFNVIIPVERISKLHNNDKNTQESPKAIEENVKTKA